MQRVASLKPELAHFTGTTNYYRHTFGYKGEPFLYTDGVQHLAMQHSCYWLLDVIFSHVGPIYGSKIIPEDQKRILVCKLAVRDDNSATFTIEDGNDAELARQEIEFSDFPAHEQEIWVQNNVALLPSEY